MSRGASLNPKPRGQIKVRQGDIPVMLNDTSLSVRWASDWPFDDDGGHLCYRYRYLVQVRLIMIHAIGLISETPWLQVSLGVNTCVTGPDLDFRMNIVRKL